MTESGSLVTAEQCNQVVAQARHWSEASRDWTVFFREVLGVGGAVRRTFPNKDALGEFERTETYREILEMLKELRESRPVNEDTADTTVITVRLPRSLHDSLRSEAHEHRTSMNKLCISKLLQLIDGNLVPAERYRPKTRKKKDAEKAAAPIEAATEPETA